MDELDRDRKYLSGLRDLKMSNVPKQDTRFFDKDINKTISGSDFVEKIRKLKGLKRAGKVASKGLKSLPLIGGIIAGLSSEDASAAIPVLGEAGDLGSPADSLEGRFERNELTPEERIKFLKRIGDQ